MIYINPKNLLFSTFLVLQINVVWANQKQNTDDSKFFLGLEIPNGFFTRKVGLRLGYKFSENCYLENFAGYSDWGSLSSGRDYSYDIESYNSFRVFYIWQKFYFGLGPYYQKLHTKQIYFSDASKSQQIFYMTTNTENSGLVSSVGYKSFIPSILDGQSVIGGVEISLDKIISSKTKFKVMKYEQNFNLEQMKSNQRSEHQDMTHRLQFLRLYIGLVL